MQRPRAPAAYLSQPPTVTSTPTTTGLLATDRSGRVGGGHATQGTSRSRHRQMLTRTVRQRITTTVGGMTAASPPKPWAVVSPPIARSDLVRR